MIIAKDCGNSEDRLRGEQSYISGSDELCLLGQTTQSGFRLHPGCAALAHRSVGDTILCSPVLSVYLEAVVSVPASHELRRNVQTFD